MTEQFENPAEIKVENDAALAPSNQQKVQVIADKAAGKSAETEKKFDKENSPLFSR